MLDTSILIDIEANVKSTIDKLIEISKFDSKIASMSFITYFELLYGLKEKSSKNQQKHIERLRKFKFLNASQKTAEILADLKYKYDKKGIIFSLTDFIIVAQAYENNLTLLTKDKQFYKIEEIKTIIFD